jgi:uroporphyrinogen-III synthase
MHLIVTRPEPEAGTLARQLEELGHEPILAPLMRLSFDNPDDVDLSEAQAIIATSRNAMRALSLNGRLAAIARGLPLFAVGKGTADAARALGFEVIVTGAGTAADLVPQIASTFDPAAGPLVHLAGEVLAYDLAGELRLHGFSVETPVVYRTLAAKRLPPVARTAIMTGIADGVILMSPGTAALWVRLLSRDDLTGKARQMTHFCLSDAIAEKLRPLGTIRTEIAATPKLEELLALVT